MIDQLEGLCTQLAFQCALMVTSVLFGNTEVTSAYSGEYCDHRCTLGVGSVSCGSIHELVWMFLLKFALCLMQQ